MNSAFNQITYPIKSDKFKEKEVILTVWNVTSYSFKKWTGINYVLTHVDSGFVLYKNRFVPVSSVQTDNARKMGMNREWTYDQWVEIPKEAK